MNDHNTELSAEKLAKAVKELPPEEVARLVYANRNNLPSVETIARIIEDLPREQGVKILEAIIARFPPNVFEKFVSELEEMERQKGRELGVQLVNQVLKKELSRQQFVRRLSSLPPIQFEEVQRIISLTLYAGNDLIEQLTTVEESTNWKGKPNWQWLGATERCWRCGKVVGDEIEPGATERHHIIPKSEGGPNTDDNLALLCANCHEVIHKYRMNFIGMTRTRDGDWRTIADVKGILKISHKMRDSKHKLGRCTECGSTAKVTGVSEGYWGGKGMIVFLDCGACGHAFAIPFLELTPHTNDTQ
jgi:hypothetical protein